MHDIPIQTKRKNVFVYTICNTHKIRHVHLNNMTNIKRSSISVNAQYYAQRDTMKSLLRTDFSNSEILHNSNRTLYINIV